MNISEYRKDKRKLELVKGKIEDELSLELEEILSKWMRKISNKHHACVKKIDVIVLDTTTLGGEVDYTLSYCEVKI